MNKAIFLDRDGVINPLVYNLLTGEYESPHYLEDFSVFPFVAGSLKKALGGGYRLFLVTNQPSYAKGKTTLENIEEIHTALDQYLRENGVSFSQYYYCYHHPQGIVPEYTKACECRKPNNGSVLEAAAKFNLDLAASWFVGDQDSDIQCGQSSGLKTIQIENKHSVKKRGKSKPDYYAVNLKNAIDLIIP